MVLGITVDWESAAVRSETAAVPSALQARPLEASALPRWKGGAINQPICGAMHCLAIHLSPWSLMGKTGQGGLVGKGWKGFTYLGRGKRSCREAGQGRGLYQPNDPVTQGPREAVKRGTTREAPPRVRVGSR